MPNTVFDILSASGGIQLEVMTTQSKDGYPEAYSTVLIKDATQTIFDAESGDLDAQVALDDMYESSYGIEQDYGAARNLYSPPVTQDDSEGQHKMVITYSPGIEVLSDPTAAMKWLRKAADQGNVAAECTIGNKYQYNLIELRKM
ncbi:hypothetical protein FBU30_005649 [Linnemannia zychae]|nr:hypothetical protein FBU30_005649 [Linnemannia zychae]